MNAIDHDSETLVFGRKTSVRVLAAVLTGTCATLYPTELLSGLLLVVWLH
jgi:hypothetical protein